MSTSNSNASNLSQTAKIISEYTKISQDTSPKSNAGDHLDQENSPALFERGPASPTRSGRLSAPFTPVSSPLRKILSPRKSTLSSQPSSRRVSGSDLVQDLAASLQLSFTEASHTGAGESSSRNPVVNPINERRTPATSTKSLPSTNCSAHDGRPVTPHSSPARNMSYTIPMTPKKRLLATSDPAQSARPPTGRSSPRRLGRQMSQSGALLNGEDLVQELAQSLEAPVIASPPLSSSSETEAKPSLQVPDVVDSPVEREDTLVPVTVAGSEPEGATRSNPIWITEELKSEDSNSEDTVSLSDEKPSQRRKRTRADDEEETDEATIGPYVNKRMKCNIPIFDRTATLQGDIYGLDLLFEEEGEFHSFDNINNTWTIHGESKEVDDPSTRGNDKQVTIQSALPISLEWEERESQTSTAAALLSADELYVHACTTLRAYKHRVELGADADVQRKARDEMANAWKQWRQRSLDFIDMGALRQYGEVLDSKGRLAIADALGVQSSSLVAWVEESLTTEEKEERRRERKQISAPKELAPGFTPDFVDFSQYINFGDDEEDANKSTDNDLSTLAYAPPMLPPLIPLIPSTPAILPHHVPLQHVVAPVPQASSSTVAFSKTPEDLVKTGPLPKWAKGVLYCNSHQSLKQWMDARATSLVQKADVLGDKEKWLLDELNGPPRSNLTRGEMKIRPSTRAFNGLPDDQKPVLLHGKAAVKEFTESKHEREFVVVCRTSFHIEENGVFDYRTRPCGHVVTSHDILIRHVREQHLAQKRRPVSEVPVVAVELETATPDTPVVTASTSTGDVAPSLPSNSGIESP
ncbi:hypothetical protein FRB91_005097 [Serendipita sp. 411]|nr:hypothetical protein FRB91_005097 [Serendipita sp. 411]